MGNPIQGYGNWDIDAERYIYINYYKESIRNDLYLLWKGYIELIYKI